MTAGGAVAGQALAAIEVVNVGKAYDRRPVLRSLSFEVNHGEIFALLGPNGAGKTTTVEIIEGYRRPDSGQVHVLGTDPGRAGRSHRARVGLMLQGGGGIDPRMTAREVVGLHARFHADPRPVDALLDLVGLIGATARTRYRRLSGGERQRVGLALALVGNPDLVVLDEPTAGMDVEARGATRKLLAELRSRGMTILLTSHDLIDVERLADRLAILDRGRVVALGAPDELTAASSPVVRFRLGVPLSEPDRLDLGEHLSQLPSGDRVTVEHDEGAGRYRLDGLTPKPALIAQLAAWCATRGVLIADLRSGGGTLEERYLELIGVAGEETRDEGGATDGTTDDPAVHAGRRGRRRS